MKITGVVAQFPISLSVQQNLNYIDSVLNHSNPGDLVVFPEGSVSGYSDDVSFLESIDPLAIHTALDGLQKEAQKRAIHLWVGACTRLDEQWFNSAYGFTANGQRHVYHKINLAAHERGVFAAGNRLPVFELHFPDGVLKIGVQLCRELRFPEQWGWLARSGAQILLHLNNAVGDASQQPVWKSHLVSRAAETQRFVLSANNAARMQISPTIAIDPGGRVSGEIVSGEPDALRLELDVEKVSNWYLDQCRTDIIAIRP